MTEPLMLGDRARWEVLWITNKGGRKRVIVHEFETDLKSALEFYHKVKLAKKPFATLRCCNVAFPPPEKYRPHTAKVKRYTGKTKIVTRNGKRYRKKLFVIDEVERDPMLAVNLKGYWWCPYCLSFRKFLEQDGFRINGIYVPEKGVHCPTCEISHRNYYVRKWNPHAQMLQFRIGTRGSKSSGPRKRKRTSRKTR